MATKLTVRIDDELLQGAKRYAAENDTTLTRLVTAFFERLAQQAPGELDAPHVRRVTGILPPGASEQEYYDYLEHKYLGE